MISRASVLRLGLSVLVMCLGVSGSDRVRAENAAAQLQAGIAAVEIVMPEGAPLGGYGSGDRRLKKPNLKFRKNPNHIMFAPHTGTRDSIRAKALLIKSGDKKLLFIGIDLVGANLELWQAVVEHLQPRGYDRNEIFVSATHTHSGPGALSKNIFWAAIALDFFQKKAYDAFMGSIYSAIDQAEANLRPAEIRFTSFDVNGISHNRRRDEAGVDPTARVFWIRDQESGKFMGSMVNYAIHGVALDDDNLAYSSDVPGGIERAIEDRLAAANGSGSRPVTIFINGAEGDISPNAFRDEGIRSIGKTFGDTALEHVGEGRVLPGDWTVDTTEVQFGKPGLNIHACADNMRPDKENKAISWIGKNAAIGVGAFFPDNARLWSISWGGLRMMTWPGEPINELGRRLRKLATDDGATDSLVMGLTNGHLAYFLTPEEFELAGYEACVNLFGPQGGIQVLDAYDHLWKSKHPLATSTQ